MTVEEVEVSLVLREDQLSILRKPQRSILEFVTVVDNIQDDASPRLGFVLLCSNSTFRSELGSHKVWTSCVDNIGGVKESMDGQSCNVGKLEFLINKGGFYSYVAPMSLWIRFLKRGKDPTFFPTY